METLRNILLEKRKKRGSVNFDIPEAKIILTKMANHLRLSRMKEMLLQALLKNLCLFVMKL